MLGVLDLDGLCFDYPWGEEGFLRRLRRRFCIGHVAEIGDRVVGFMVYERLKPTFRLLRFAVHPEFRRLRVGAQMIDKLIQYSAGNQIVVPVRETSLGAQLFFRWAGFAVEQVVRGRYPETGEDAYFFFYWPSEQGGT
jgi:[ribosomal protein S18]-alanine N-acetyltransferase